MQPIQESNPEGQPFEKKPIDKPIRTGILLNLLLINQDELVKSVKVDHNLGCSNYKTVTAKILKEVR